MHTVAHLVEFVNAADAAVGEHEGPALEDKFARLWIACHVGGEPDS